MIKIAKVGKKDFSDKRLVDPQEDPQVIHEIPEAIPLEDPEPVPVKASLNSNTFAAATHTMIEPEEIPEPAPVDVEDPGAEEIPAEVPTPHEETRISRSSVLKDCVKAAALAAREEYRRRRN